MVLCRSNTHSCSSSTDVVAAGNYAVVGNKVYGVRSVETISEGLSQDEYIDLIAKRL